MSAITDEIAQRASGYPDRPAIVTIGGETITYAQLVSRLPENFGTTYRTSASSGPRPKHVSVAAAVTVRKIARLNRVRGPGFRAARKLFLPWEFEQAAGAHVALSMFLRGRTIYRFMHWNEALFWQTCEKDGVDTIVYQPVGFWRKLMDYNGAYRFENALVSGSLVTRDDMLLIRERFADGVWFNYGTTETGAIAGGDIETVLAHEGCVGHVDQDLTVEIIDDEIVVTSNDLPVGYDDNSEETTRRFKGGKYYTRDRGRFEGDLLIVEGRIE